MFVEERYLKESPICSGPGGRSSQAPKNGYRGRLLDNLGTQNLDGITGRQIDPGGLIRLNTLQRRKQ